MKKITSILWGLIFIAIGVIVGLNTLEITDIDIFFNGWWTLFIIIPSFIGLFKDNDKTGNIIVLIIGVVLLLACQNVIDFQMVWKLIVPVILVIIGLSILFKNVIFNKVNKAISKLNKDRGKSYCSTFGSQTVNFDNEVFEGCEVNAVFGAIKLDLRNAIIKEDVVVNISAIFGGIDVYVPKDVKVKVSSTPIFGGVDNRYVNAKDEKAKTIYFNATSIFGGTDIK